MVALKKDYKKTFRKKRILIQNLNKKWWFRAESNHRHEDFQSSALPTELRNHHLAVWTGLEPATSAVTGRHSNQLNYQTILVAGEGFEPTTFGL